MRTAPPTSADGRALAGAARPVDPYAWLALTRPGDFHDHAEIMTGPAPNAARHARSIRPRRQACLTIAATHVLSFTFFPKWVRGNERILALGNLNLISDSMQACEQMMLRGDAQFLLCHHHKDASSRLAFLASSRASWSASTRCFRLRACEKRRAAVVAGGEPENTLPIARNRDWADRRCPWEAKDRAFALETVFTSHLAATLLSMARAGDGMAWLPRTLAEEDISAGRLVEAGKPGFADGDRNSPVSSGRAAEPCRRVGMDGLSEGLTFPDAERLWLSPAAMPHRRRPAPQGLAPLRLACPRRVIFSRSWAQPSRPSRSAAEIQTHSR